MEMLDTTILNTAVPSIATSLGVAPLSMKSVLSSYTLSLALFIPVSGWVADRFGTRRVFATAIGIFTLGSLLCGLSQSIHMLVACRILQGCGGAMMLPVGRLTVVRTFSKTELIRALSFVAIPGLIGPMLGPVAGGLIIAYFHWSLIFFVNIPIGLVGLYLVYRYLPDFRASVHTPLDVVGMVLFGSGISVLSYVLEVFGEHTLSTSAISALLILSVVLLGAYAFNSVRLKYPLLDVDLFALRTFRIAVVGSFVTRLGVGGVPFLLPLLYQVGFGFSAIQSGLLMMPQAFAAMSLKFAMPSILARFGYKRILFSNTLLLGCLIMGFAMLTPTIPLWLLIPLLFLYGFIASMQFTSMNTLVYADVPEKETSGASTISSTAQQMSMSFAVALASLVSALLIPNHIQATPSEFMRGISEAFVALGIVTIISASVFLWLKKNDGDSISKRESKVVKSVTQANPQNVLGA